MPKSQAEADKNIEKSSLENRKDDNQAAHDLTIATTSSLVSGSVLFFLANVVIVISGFILAAILIHKMPDYIYGASRTLQRIIVITTIIALKGIGNSIIIHFSEKNVEKEKISDMIIASVTFSIISGLVFAVLVFFVVVFVVQPRVDVLGNLSIVRLLFGLLFVFPLTFSVSSLNSSLLGQKKIKHSVMAISIQSIGNLLFSTLFVYLGFGAFSVILGLGFGSLLSVIYSMLINKEYIVSFFKRKRAFRNILHSFKSLRLILSFSSPIVLASISTQLIEGAMILTILGFFFENGHLAYVQIAYFNYVFMLIMATRIPQDSIGRMILPHLRTLESKDARKELQRAIRFMMLATIPINVVFGVFTEEIQSLFQLIISSSSLWLGTSTIIPLLRLLIIGGQISSAYYLLMNSNISLRKPNIYAKAEFIGLITLCCFSFFFVPGFGIIGIAFAFIIAYSIMLLYAIFSMLSNESISLRSVGEILSLNLITSTAIAVVYLIDFYVGIALYWKFIIAICSIALSLLIIRLNKADFVFIFDLFKRLFGARKKDQISKELEVDVEKI
ncbi:MAG: oligosaccharide flippase family protein [Candidatus Heimdallarchaeota archaeon]|nr:oligosaccharide flippase family protein [Candidatus Heimdallarchaeota archaeon]MBY8995613.1 oligosaccharide flippase family protein [Candidatus Heimdallarchaeota archaeon]